MTVARRLLGVVVLALLVSLYGPLAHGAVADRAGAGAGADSATTSGVAGELGAEGDQVTVTLFHGDGCPHCAAEIAYLTEEFVPQHPDVEVRAYEVWFNEANRALMVEAGETYGFDPGAVPVTIVAGPEGYEVFIGFGAGSGEQIVAAVERQTSPPDGADDPGQTASPVLVDVPVVGEVDLSASPLVVATLVIGFVDGVNPCSLWVLSVLLAIVLHSGSRGRVLLVGGVFLTVTAGMYAVYVAGAYSVLSLLDTMVWIRVAVALVAVTFGVVQLKDGWAPGGSVSLSVRESRRPAIYRRMRQVSLQQRGLLATVGGTVVLAVGVSLLETPCTAGLPLLWASLVADSGITTAAAVALFGVYMVVFLADELIVFAVAVVSLRSLKLQEHHGQALKIVSGSLLVTLGVTMVAVPEAMQSVGGTLLVFAAAVGVGAVIWLVGPWRQARRQRENRVPSSARTSEASDSPSSGSGEPPVTMR
jgi:cytochrome c biogenesis protein CcdA